MANLHVSPGLRFRRDLYARERDRTEWFRAVGAELEGRNVRIQVGNRTLGSGAEAAALYGEFQSNPAALLSSLGLPSMGQAEFEAYFADLAEAIDDVVAPTSNLSGTVDLSPGSGLGKELGLDVLEPYAGPATPVGGRAETTFRKVDGVVVSRSEDPLANVPYIDSTTFASLANQGWPRDGSELEKVSSVTGADFKELHSLLKNRGTSRRTGFQEVRRAVARVCEAYTTGYRGVALDEMRWDAGSHRQRELNKFVPLVIENGNFEPDEPGEERSLQLGTDIMDDFFGDTRDWALTDADILLRGRRRWDNDTQIRRLLVQQKEGTHVDPELKIKVASKQDIRTDSATEASIRDLEKNVFGGHVPWGPGGALQPAVPLVSIHRALAAAGKLPEVAGRSDVLLLEPKVYVRSTRSRYHLAEPSIDALGKFYEETMGKLPGILTLAERAKAALAASGATSELGQVQALVERGSAMMSGAYIAELARPALEAIEPGMTVDAASIQALLPWRPGSLTFSPVSDITTVQKKKAVADALDVAFHQFAEQVGTVRSLLCGSPSETLEPAAELFASWVKDSDPSLVNKRTMDASLAKYEAASLAGPAAKEALRQAFNAYGEAERANGNDDYENFVALDAAQFDALRPVLLDEVVRVNQRQLEAAGSTALALWFEEARRYYVPEAYRNTGNFMIDTTDMAEVIRPETWQRLLRADGSPPLPSTAFPSDEVIHCELKNELQIELGLEKPYLDAIDRYSAEISKDRISLLMKYFDTQKAPAQTADSPALYLQRLSGVLSAPASVEAELARINAFLLSQRSELTPLTAADLQKLGVDVFEAATAYLVSTGAPGVLPGQPQTAFDALALLASGPTEAFEAEVVRMNEFLKNRPGALVVTVTQLRRLVQEQYTPENRDRPVRTGREFEQKLTGARFVFEQILDAKEHLVAGKGERVLDALRARGLTGDLGWSQTDGASGDRALAAVRQAPARV